MKTLIVLLSLIFSCLTIYSQTEDLICGGAEEVPGVMPLDIESIRGATGIPVGGREITNQGILRVLIIFVRFKDDYINTPTWPDYNVLPSWAENIIDGEVPANNLYTPGNISDFMDRASGGDGAGNLGIFKVIGDVYYVTTDEDSAHYGNNFSSANSHVLNKLNNQIDYTQYDNWKFMKNGEYYNHEYVPAVGDGKIDYVLFFYRRINSQIAGLKGYSIPGNFILDGKHFNGYGSTQFGYRNHGPTKVSITVPVHEFSHYLFSGTNTTGHLDGRVVYGNQQNIGNVSFFALMLSVASDNSFYSAFERYRAGWLNPTVLETSSSSMFLQDTHKRHKAFLIPLRYSKGSPSIISEYYLIENYHTTNAYAGANPFLTTSVFNNTFDHGLLVFHIEEEDYNIPTNSNLDIECADGLWDFYLKEGADTPNDRTDDVLAKFSPSRIAGYDERDAITLAFPPTSYNDYYCLTPASCGSSCPPNHGRRYHKDATLGDTDDFFRYDGTRIFSTWSNPQLCLASGGTVYKGFEIKGYYPNLREYEISFQSGYDNVLSLSPSKPHLGWYHPGNGPIYQGWIYLGWGADLWDGYPIEPDINWSELQRKIGTGSWSTVYSGPNRYWSDGSITYDPNGTTPVYFRVRVRDSQNLWSVWSELFDTKMINSGIGVGQKTVADNSIADEVTQYMLKMNYPNPFNPSTVIHYSVKDAGLVSLKVFDILGREVAMLVNDFIESGYHSVEFNASDLPSGVYIYSLQVNGYTSSKKMLLLK